MKTVALFVAGVVVAPAAAVIVYLHGVWVGPFLDLRAISEFCPAKPVASTPTSTDLVPAYVNPVVFLCVAAGVACTALAVRSTRRTGRISPAP